MDNRGRWTWALALCIGLFGLVAESRGQTTSSSRPSVGDSISSSISQSVDKFGQTINPKTPADDPVNLKTPGKPGVELYVAVARLYEEAGKFAEAEEQYNRAKRESPNDIRVLLGYARLKDHMDQPQEALKFYQEAAQQHPNDPSVFNNMAVHHARQGMLREAVSAMNRAIQLRPKEPRYRNNMATLLVELGRPRDAFYQLVAIYPEAVSHYNLGFLLIKKEDKQAAAAEFATAWRIDPTMILAKQWLDRLSGELSLATAPIRSMPPATLPPPQAAAAMPAPTMPGPQPAAQMVGPMPGPMPGGGGFPPTGPAGAPQPVANNNAFPPPQRYAPQNPGAGPAWPNGPDAVAVRPPPPARYADRAGEAAAPFEPQEMAPAGLEPPAPRRLPPVSASSGPDGAPSDLVAPLPPVSRQ